MPPALGLFSTMIDCPSGLPMACATTRATVSVGPPAAYGTSKVMFFVGYCCAPAVPAANASAKATRRAAFMGNPPIRRLSADNKRHERDGRPSFRYRDAALGTHASRDDGGAARGRRLRRRPNG